VLAGLAVAMTCAAFLYRRARNISEGTS